MTMTRPRLFGNNNGNNRRHLQEDIAATNIKTEEPQPINEPQNKKLRDSIHFHRTKNCGAPDAALVLGGEMRGGEKDQNEKTNSNPAQFKSLPRKLLFISLDVLTPTE